MDILINNENSFEEFISLNENWISEHFTIEESDVALAADPESIIRDGGYIFTALDDGAVVGACALFNLKDNVYELARMAVATTARGQGIGNALMCKAISYAEEIGGVKLILLSNTILKPAISLYLKHGFETVFEGKHPEYSRCNIVMEKALT